LWRGVVTDYRLRSVPIPSAAAAQGVRPSLVDAPRRLGDETFERDKAYREPTSWLDSRMREIERRFVRLPGHRPFPLKLERFGQALEQCRRSRDVEPTVNALKTHLDVLRDGFEALGRFETDLDDAAIDLLVKAAHALNDPFAQLVEIEEAGEVAADAKAIAEHLDGARPWIDAQTLAGPTTRILAHYAARRAALLSVHERRAELGARRSSDARASRSSGPTTRTWRLETKTELANERLDEALARIDPRLFVKVQLALQGREIETRADLDTLLRDIDGRISPMLAKKQRVRIT